MGNTINVDCIDPTKFEEKLDVVDDSIMHVVLFKLLTTASTLVTMIHSIAMITKLIY
jgi:hypothetical protein